MSSNSVPTSPTNAPYIPSPVETEYYLYGLLSKPRMIARSSADAWMSPTGPGAYLEPKEFSVLGPHRLDYVWEDVVGPSMESYLLEQQVVVHCRSVLQGNNIEDVDVFAYESNYPLLAAMHKPAIIANLVPIPDDENIEGTGGIFFIDLNQAGKLFLLTARYVLFHPDKEENTLYAFRGNSGDPQRKAAIGAKQIIIEQLHRRLEAAKTLDEDKATLERNAVNHLIMEANSAITAFQKLHDDVLMFWMKKENCVIGHVTLSTPLTLKHPDCGFAEDWAVVEILPSMISKLNFIGNAIDLGSVNIDGLTAWMYPHGANPPSFKYPGHRLLRFSGTLSDVEMYNSTPKTRDQNNDSVIMVLKNSNTTNLTVGQLNTIRAFTRTCFKGESSNMSKEIAVLPRTSKSGPSSDKGDSGSVVADGKGTSKPENDVVSAAKPRHPKFYFDNTLVVLEVEGTLFNVHKYQLMKSETFSDMFKAANQDPEEGATPDKPIVLEGVKSSDFECLLTVLYATRFSNYQPAPEAALIIPAFRLANKWNFEDLRSFLLPLAEKELSDIDKIIFAREFDIKDWLAPAHVRLCQREEPLSSEEANKLGAQSLLLILRTREEFHRQPATSGTGTSGRYCIVCIGGPSYSSWMQSGYNCLQCGYNRNTMQGPCPSSAAAPAQPETSSIEPKVENTYFNVHKYQLMKSETFADMFTTANKDPEEGLSDEKPIVLEGVKASDFECLLTVLYATRFSTYQPTPEASLIIPAFRLANKWNFEDLRTYLLPLAENELSDVDKVMFAREFNIREWLIPTHTRLCSRNDPITTEEAQKLGLDSLLFIYRTREKLRGNSLSQKTIEQLNAGQMVCGNCIGYTLQSTNAGQYRCTGCSVTTYCYKRSGSSNPSQLETKVKEWVENGCRI
ncbi:The BTB (BR-C, ttk and bab)/POZ (Pox virus and Zinc finger) domain [Ceratobasidium sp. AG-Ba]|nr:The BTB (BR-C, ttk and bab)/POZ (Pox virus and Zinc finger) domain [Ceratobasidium sp. AG-Ba]